MRPRRRRRITELHYVFAVHPLLATAAKEVRAADAPSGGHMPGVAFDLDASEQLRRLRGQAAPAVPATTAAQPYHATLARGGATEAW